MPAWVKDAIEAWRVTAGIAEGTVFRAISKRGRVWGHGMTAKVLWDVLRHAAAAADIAKLAPHDLRRTCARLCHLAWGELDQIQFCSDMSRFKQPSATSDANRSSGTP